MAELDFAILEEATLPDFQPLPEGWWRAEVVTAEKKESAAGNNYLSVEFSVTDEVPANSRTRVWGNYNLWHPSDMVIEIAQRQFSDLARACGLANCKDTDELVDKPVELLLKLEAGNGEYAPKNKVTAYRSAPKFPTPAATTDRSEELKMREADPGPAASSETPPPWQEGWK